MSCYHPIFTMSTGKIFLPAICLTVSLFAAKLDTVQVVDNRTLMIKFLDARVSYRDDFGPKYNARGEITQQSWYDRDEGDDTLKEFGLPLNKMAADAPASWTITSADDPEYAAGRSPLSVSRKSKPWGVSLTAQEPAMNHWIFLSLHSAMRRGTQYTVTISGASNADVASKTFLFDEAACVSEAVHVNVVGYNPDAPWKTGDIYIWMGSGGARDFSAYEGNRFYLRNEESGADEFSGTMRLWKSNETQDIVSWYENIGSAVWRCDFSDFAGNGTYRLVVEGIGSSVPFSIKRNVYFEPYKVATRGYFFQRLGDSTKAGIEPNSRPVSEYRPGRTANFEVVMSAVHAVGINPDEGCASRALSGNPVNPDAWGGWRDAADFDRHYMHSIAAFDLMLAYLLAPGAYSDGDLDINESGNGIPDILDEVRFEIDFFLRLRTPDGDYGTAIGNPESPDELQMCQFGPHPLQAWNVAAGCAMLAFCFDRASLPSLCDEYRDSALVAYQYAMSRDPQAQAEGRIHYLTARCLKTMAAVYLYNITGERAYEDVFNTLARTRITGTSSKLVEVWPDNAVYDMTYVALGYLVSPRTINYQTLRTDIRSSVQHVATTEGYEKMRARKSSRSHLAIYGVWSGENVTGIKVQHICMAHRFSTTGQDSIKFAQALYAEAEWHLGRNPMNIAHMTGLGNRCVDQMFTTGQYDGYPGVVPGCTPYMSNEVWVGWPYGNTKRYCEPDNGQWPLGELWFNSRYDVGNSEYTIHQSMRGPVVLYGYLHGIEHAHPFYPSPVKSRHTPAGPPPPGVDVQDVRIQGSRIVVSQSVAASSVEIKLVSLDGRTVRHVKKEHERLAKVNYDLSRMRLPPGAYVCVVLHGETGYYRCFQFVR